MSTDSLVTPEPAGIEGESLAVLLENRFLVVAIACQRVIQIRAGARPHLDPDGHKPCVMAVAEVVAGAVPYFVS